MFLKCVLVFAFCCALVLVPGSSLGQEPGKAISSARSGAAMGRSIEQQLMKLTEEFAAAEVRGDMAALDSLLADDFAHTHSTGRVATKAKDMDDIKSGRRRYESIHLEDLQVRLYGTTALTLGRARIQVINLGKTSNNYIQFLNVWVQQQGKWRMVAWQTTRVQENS